ncbi:uncharacterized protein LOC130744894 [Lotus japonicus]|uniref:uncharacterized protein LOC130744894 n=1 Tax=Lotus japonicus TaxID=34305 RepID=UPI002587A48C|nr:uncharacterized protein LOC130744894 [Lotus japonicus]
MWKVGNGERINIWRDACLPNRPPVHCNWRVVHDYGIQKVSHLISYLHGGWNRTLLDMIFPLLIVASILAILLATNRGEDVLFWPMAQDGFYTTKLGYRFVSKHQHVGVASSSSKVFYPPDFWSKIWGSNALPRCKEVVWRACLSVLPVRVLLRACGMEVSTECPFSADHEEFVAHVLLLCEAVRGCWFASNLGVCWDPSSSSFGDAMQALVSAMDAEDVGRVCAMIYALWEARNRVIFDGQPFDLGRVLQRAQGLLADEGAASVQLRRAPVMHSTWQRPSCCVYKVNFDAAMSQDGVAGFGMVVRDEEGAAFAAATASSFYALSEAVGEVMRLRWAMSLAVDLGFRSVCLETDCLQLFEVWKKGGVGRSYLATLVQEARSLSSFFDVVNLSFIRRTGNCVVDFF